MTTSKTQSTQYLDRPEGRVAYEVSGDGPLVVLVPGMGDLRAAYRFLAPALEEAGYIRGYPPGLRENGGQYSHAAMWAVLAFAKLGEGDKATSLFGLLNPLAPFGRMPRFPQVGPALHIEPELRRHALTKSRLGHDNSSEKHSIDFA